jgi:hypothetical protein
MFGYIIQFDLSLFVFIRVPHRYIFILLGLIQLEFNKFIFFVLIFILESQ